MQALQEIGNVGYISFLIQATHMYAPRAYFYSSQNFLTEKLPHFWIIRRTLDKTTNCRYFSALNGFFKACIVDIFHDEHEARNKI